MKWPIGRVARGPSAEPTWFAAAGLVVPGAVLLGVGALSPVPGLLAFVLVWARPPSARGVPAARTSGRRRR